MTDVPAPEPAVARPLKPAEQEARLLADDALRALVAANRADPSRLLRRDRTTSPRA